MPNIFDESIIALSDVPGLLPRPGKPVSAPTVHRWIHDGILSADGELIKLQAVRLGGRWITSKEAVRRFVHAQVGDVAHA